MVDTPKLPTLEGSRHGTCHIHTRGRVATIIEIKPTLEYAGFRIDYYRSEVRSWKAEG
jgi:hypothetical protein